MKILLPGVALFLLLVPSSWAQIYPNRPAGVVTANHDVVTRFGLSDYVLTATRPEFPAGAMRQGITGRGVFLADLSLLYGTVNDVRVLESTGSQALDDAAMAAISQWTFRRYTIYKASIPVDFGADGRVWVGSDPAQAGYISSILAHVDKVPRHKHKH
jgi:TonB family protein